MTALRTSAAEALAELLDNDGRGVCLVGDPGGSLGDLAGAVAASAPARVVMIGGSQARQWVASGLAAAGRRPVALLEAGTAVSVGSQLLGQVLVTDDLGTAEALLGAGVTVVQPAWPADVAPLLRAATAAPAPVAVRLHDGRATEASDPVDAPVFGRPRVLRRGGALSLGASGAAVAVLADVARMLAGRGVDVSAVEVHTFRPGRSASLALYDGVLLVGDGAGGVPGAPRVHRFSVSGDVRAVMEAVLAAVSAAPDAQPSATRRKEP